MMSDDQVFAVCASLVIVALIIGNAILNRP